MSVAVTSYSHTLQWEMDLHFCRLFGGALLWMKFRHDKWMDYLRSDMKKWIRGTKNLDSAGQSLCLLIPDPCLSQLDTFSNVEWRWTARNKFEIWNAISRSAVVVKCVCFTVWHLCWKLYSKVGKFHQPANGMWPIYFTRQNIVSYAFGKWRVTILNPVPVSGLTPVPNCLALKSPLNTAILPNWLTCATGLISPITSRQPNKKGIDVYRSLPFN